MTISIRERLKPFSHMPGAACLIPGTCWTIEAFPALIRIGKKYELNLHITGPVKDFTLEQDLEKNCIFIFGKAKEGLYRLKITAEPNGIEVKILNAPKGFLINGDPLKAQNRLFFDTEIEFYLPVVWERLSLGKQKAQDWDLVLRRFDLQEILPVLFGLGQKVPYTKPHPLRGTGRVLDTHDFEAFLRAAFSKILLPRFIDDEHQGIAIVEEADGHPCFLLQEGARRVRSLFFDQEGKMLSLLPSSTFAAGRMTHLTAAGIGTIDLEWGSHTLRRAVLRSDFCTEIRLDLSKGLRSFRIRTQLHSKGERRSSKEAIEVEAGKTYYFDRFQK